MAVETAKVSDYPHHRVDEICVQTDYNREHNEQGYEPDPKPPVRISDPAPRPRRLVLVTDKGQTRYD